MGVFVGMDEAGYGPNLGPLVVVATAWEVPGDPREFDWWAVLDDAVTNAPQRDDERVHVGDSKAVHSPSRGLAPLERSVLAILRATGATPRGLRELWSSLHPNGECGIDGEPWFQDRDQTLPLSCEESIDAPAERLAASVERAGVRLRAIHCDAVLVSRFNELCRRHGNKAAALPTVSVRLLRTVWDPDDGEETLVVADKHGGRNRYDQLLSEVLDDRMVRTIDEGRDRSRYRVGRSEVCFQTRAESWFPVAVASMVAKYVREVAMHLFNAYWRAEVPDLRPTKGYPTDARRFRDDVAEARRRLEIADDVFWRER